MESLVGTSELKKVGIKKINKSNLRKKLKTEYPTLKKLFLIIDIKKQEKIVTLMVNNIKKSKNAFLKEIWKNAPINKK